MQIEGKTQYSHYKIAYHVVWITKYRKKLLVDNIKHSLEDIIYQTSQEKNWKIQALEIMSDHAHLFVTAPPSDSPAKVAKLFKGISARRLLMKYPELSTYKGRSKLWSPSYYIGTAGNVSAETIKRYIQECQNA